MQSAVLILLCVCPAPAQVVSCSGSASLEDFRLAVELPKGGEPIPLARINGLHAGERLKYEPVYSGSQTRDKAKIAIILVAANRKTPSELTVLEARPASKATEWGVPFETSVVGVVFGPQGLDVSKIHSLLDKKQELIPQLADYADQTAQVGALVEALAAAEHSPPNQHGLDAALDGFSSRYGVSLPKITSDAHTDEQALQLLRAILPSLSSYDPLTAQRTATVQQSAGLAASLASLFLGNPVTLAAGGTALFQNLRTLMFPGTDFRSAFAQFKNKDEMSLCSKPETAKSHSRTAYLWALRIPGTSPPAISLPTDLCLPIGWKSSVKVSVKDGVQLKLLPRVQGWELASRDGKQVQPVSVSASSSAPGILEFDTSRTTLPAGEYRLEGKWDWSSFTVNGDVGLRPFSDLTEAAISPQSEDRLVQGSGTVPVQVVGADFEFVNKVSLISVDSSTAPAIDLVFRFPQAKSGAARNSLEAMLDTRAHPQGKYLLRLTQLNGKSCDLPLTVHPPNPVLENLPLRANVGEKQQTICLRGTGLDRIEKISGAGMVWTLASSSPPSEAKEPGQRQATLALDKTAREGTLLDISLLVSGIHQPLPVRGAVEVVGPRPVILSADKSFPPEMSVELRPNEIPAGFPVSFALKTKNLASTPELELSCGQDDSKPALVLQPGESRTGAKLDFAGEGVLFLSVDPGKLGSTGCNLKAVVKCNPTGESDSFLLGRIILVPQIEKFELTDEKINDALYVGILTGRELQTIDKAGWDAQHGYPVLGIPTPVVGQTDRQTLRVALPWPAPAPKAPIFIWLRGEEQGRTTQARF